MALLKIAWRNLWRNTRRSIIIMSALALGLIVLVFFLGLGDGMHEQMIFNGTRSLIGHVQIHECGYLGDPSMDKRIPYPTNPLIQTTSTYPNAVHFSPRIFSQGLIAKNEEQDDANLEETALEPQGFILVGIDPKSEPKITNLKRSLVRGNWLDETGTLWFMGKNFTNLFGVRWSNFESHQMAIYAHPTISTIKNIEVATSITTAFFAAFNAAFSKILIGSDLAKVLGIQTGDVAALMTVTAKQFLSDRYVIVSGIFKADQQEINRSMVFMDINVTRTYVEIEDEVMEIAFWLDDSLHIDDFVAFLKSRHYPSFMTRLNNILHATNAQPLEILPWQEVSPELDIYIKIDDASLYVTGFIIFIVVALSILNTVMMSTMERTHEFGVLLAVGTKPSWIVRLVILETFLLIMVSVVIGVVIGVLITYYVQVNGMSFGPEEWTIVGVTLDPMIYPKIIPWSIVKATVMIVGIGLVAGIYPSIQAARLDPIKAIHHL